MRTTNLNTIHTDALEYEFIPPFNLDEMSRETIGLAWEQQLSATTAWQAAIASIEETLGLRESASMIVPPLPEGSDSLHASEAAGNMSMRTIMVMNTLLLSLRERLLQIQNETANLAIDNISRRQAMDSETMPQLSPESAARMEVLLRAWFDIMTAAQTKMQMLTGFSPARGKTGLQQFFQERRHQARVIDFPDRRLAS
ncbi:hypothetical protein [Azoarcus sp. KH32C]|uniref:hypothetical protein n=1 Tax=Azoarcus sp. KH32C TaxID=748247 RepID=UPI0002386B73|nr:hypothetical protein [Azoarcus sp. KH32C]BAL24873.1 hypothetical protein AZKH_2567 [Azoarcus sp. KH32C]